MPAQLSAVDRGPELRHQLLAGPPPGRAQALRVLVADDHRLLREGVRRALEGAGLDVVGEAADGQEALALVDQLDPDVVLMDITMPVLDGIDATAALARRRPDLPVIVLTMHSDPDTLDRATRAGAAGYLVKDCTSDEILVAVENIFGLGRPAGDGAGAGGGAGGSPAPRRGWSDHSLTVRELQVLELLAKGCSTAQLASRLFISPRTVKNHLASIYDKLDAGNRTQAVVQAARLGLVQLG